MYHAREAVDSNRLTRRIADLDGRRVSYLDRGGGPAFVLIHAFPLNAAMWATQIDALADRWRVVAPDLPGFGPDAAALGPPAVASMDEYAAIVLALADALGIGQAVVGGGSMGGYVAFALLRRAADRVRGLLLMDTRPQADTEQGRAARVEMRRLVEERGVAAVADQMVPRLVADPGETGDRVRRLALEATPGGVTGALAAMMGRPDSSATLAAVRVPALVVAGSLDTLTPVADAERMHALIAGSALEVIEGAGHLPNLEQPAAFNERLIRFADGIRS
jgi:pimeloyl-ACP methyl ester carboxylesterase